MPPGGDGGEVDDGDVFLMGPTGYPPGISSPPLT